MNKGRARTASLFDSPVLTGAVVVLVMVIGIYISYGADRGLPFVPTLQVSVEVPDAAKLTVGDAVHVGGARVGQVIKQTAVPGNPPYSRLTLALAANQRVPTDSTVAVRPLSILGSKYVALTVGKAKTLVPQGGTLPLAQARTGVELDQAFRVFDPQTTQAIRSAIGGLGDAMAGRAGDINQAIGATATLLPPLEYVARLLISTRTHLPGFINGLDSVTSALAPVAVQFSSIFVNGSTTLAALRAASTEFGQAIDQLPATETIGTSALRKLTPVLADAAVIAQEIRPGTRLLPSATERLARSLEAGVPTLRKGTGLANVFNNLNLAINTLTASGRPALANSLTELDTTVTSLSRTLAVLVPSQVVCDTLGIFFRNVGSAIGSGDANGSYLNTLSLLATPQTLSGAKASPILHLDPYPTENASGCAAGNELYKPGQVIGVPPQNFGTSTDQTAPPSGVSALARSAGLLDVPVGARP